VLKWNRLLLSATGLACSIASAYTPPTAYQVTQVIPANAAVFDAATQTVLATIPGSAGGSIGNTVTELTVGGDVLRSTYIGVDPKVIAISGDGSTAYIGMQSGSTVRAYDVNGATAGSEIDLGSDIFVGKHHAIDIAVSPTDKNTIAVVSAGSRFQTRTHLSLFRNGQLQTTPDELVDAAIGTSVFSSSGSTLYGFSNLVPSWELYSIGVGDGGLTYGSVTAAAFAGYDLKLKYAHGLLYASNGVVYDPARGVDVGTYANTGQLFLDDDHGLVYGTPGNGDLTVFDQATYTPITTIRTGLNLVRVSDMLNLGDGRMAIIGSQDFNSSNIYFLQAIPEPSTRIQMTLGGILMLGWMFRRQKPAASRANHSN
jgi:hypothetical protein